jgi:hybrid polyketide synthase / nonribosomal peptide synthetase ACE1
MLDLNPDDHIIVPETSLVELGVDSLVAVEVRSWFQSELDVDMPVLKILSGASIEDLAEDAFSKLPQAMTPNFQREEKPEEVKAGEGENVGKKDEDGNASDASGPTISTEGENYSTSSSDTGSEAGGS